jgi:hypothetical protein
MASRKTRVIERLFFDRYDSGSDTLTDELVTIQQVAEVLSRPGSGLSAANAANFMKDIVRSPTRNSNFPESVFALGWTVRQVTGRGKSFRFVRAPGGQNTPFLTSKPSPDLLASPYPVQTISLSPASRIFGKPHETWLTNVVTRLNVINTHLALKSSLGFLGLDLLQTNVSLGEAEIDAIYLGTLHDKSEVLVCCEMKGRRETLDEDQIERGAEKVTATTGATPLPVLPLGVKVLSGGLVWIVEFDLSFPPIAMRTEGVYELVPAVPGIG